MLIFFFLAFAFSLVLTECPPGTIFESNFNKCYKYYKTPKPFLAAEKQCNSIGGTLTSIGNAFENSFVSGIAGAETSSSVSYWIGASLLLSPTWSWTDNATFAYKNWAFGEPEASKSCAYVQDVDGKWVTTVCSTALPFMCSVDPNAQPLGGICPTPAIPTTSVKPTGKQPSSECTLGASTTCPPGFNLYTGNCRCYKYMANWEIQWPEAQSQCSQIDATLPKIDSKELNDFLYNLVGGHCLGSQCPWIGLHCTNGNTASCRWVDGSPLESYTNFETKLTHPSNGDYVYKLNANSEVANPGGWVNENMNLAQAFICETPGILPGATVTLEKKYDRKHSKDFRAA